MNERFTKKISKIEQSYIKLDPNFKQNVLFQPLEDQKYTQEYLNSLIKREDNKQYMKFCKNVMKCISTF